MKDRKCQQKGNGSLTASHHNLGKKATASQIMEGDISHPDDFLAKTIAQCGENTDESSSKNVCNYI